MPDEQLNDNCDEVILPESDQNEPVIDLETDQDPDGEIENSGKSFFLIRIPNFCYIQVIVFDLDYPPVAAVGTQQVRYHEKIVKT